MLWPLIFLFGCSPGRKINYNTERLSAPSDTELIPAMVDIKILEDRRFDFEENRVLFEQPRLVTADGNRTCINSERHYVKKDSVVNQMTKLLVEHFNEARLFNLTSFNHSEHSDHYLTGTLNSFYFEQRHSYAQVLGTALFGLLGALATTQHKTAGKIVIDISDIKLYRNDGTLVKDFGNFRKEARDEFKVSAGCWSAYRNADKMLREYNILLIEKIRSEMEGVELNRDIQRSDFSR